MDHKKSYFSEWEQSFKEYRPFLVAFAFRMTGSLSEAEDLVQETFLMGSSTDPKEIKNHKSWLTKICSNKGLDHLKSAYKRRESYHGTWLPDAVPESLQVWNSLNETPSPDKNLVLSESLTTSFLLLVERLTPEERVVYLLNEVFDYSFKEISTFLEKSEEACRKMAQRARDSMAKDRPTFSSAPSNAEELIAQFFTTAKNGDQAGLVSLLAEGSEFWADGGGKVSASASILYDKEKIARFFKGIGTSPALNSSEFRYEFSLVNSRPGLVISKKLPDGLWTIDGVYSFEFLDQKIVRIYAQRNPDKLKTLIPH